ncbi:MAG: nuclease-related domain-containing protein, partial [Lysinibacillus sp.]
MIVLKRKKPEKLIWLEVAHRRVFTDTPDYLRFDEQYRRTAAGLAGEKRVDREWDEIIYENNFHILHDICFQCSEEHTYQIDTLFICSHFLLVIEIKNIVGRIDCDERTHQFTRTKVDGTIEGFPSAIDQVHRHARFLNTILKNLNLPLPIECAIVFANSNSILNNKPATTPMFHVTG